MKNVKLNGKDYSGVSTVTLPTTSGGSAMFKDVDEIVTPSGSKSITANGTYDVSAFSQAVVSIATSGGSGSGKLVDILSRTVTSLDEQDFDGVTELGAYAFAYCKSLLSVSIPNTVKKIHSYSFANCEKMTSVELNEGLTKIGDTSFSQCKALETVEIPSTIETIEGSVFNFCTALKNVVFKGAITKILASAFSNCTALSTLDFSHCTSVPVLLDTTKVFLNVPKNCQIKVPSALLSEWQADSNWSAWGFTNYVAV